MGLPGAAKAPTEFRILIVDDSAADAGLTCQALSRYCGTAQVTVFARADAAVAYLNGIGTISPLPDLIILDLDLPGPSGLAVLRHLRCRGLPGIPVVMYTGSVSLHDKEAALALGVSAFLNKPANLEEVNRIGEIAAQLMLASGRAQVL